LEEGIKVVLSGNAFANAFWVFVGIVAGSFVQFILTWLVQWSQRRAARKALDTEKMLNLSQVAVLRERIRYLKERIAAGQIIEDDLFFSMQGFDYSMVAPLINSGHFHVMLGHEKVFDYFLFMKFFNNDNAETLNSMLRTEHEKKLSLDYLGYVEKKIEDLSRAYGRVQLGAAFDWYLLSKMRLGTVAGRVRFSAPPLSPHTVR
jgi:hypothetical protein